MQGRAAAGAPSSSARETPSSSPLLPPRRAPCFSERAAPLSRKAVSTACSSSSQAVTVWSSAWRAPRRTSQTHSRLVAAVVLVSAGPPGSSGGGSGGGSAPPERERLSVSDVDEDAFTSPERIAATLRARHAALEEPALYGRTYRTALSEFCRAAILAYGIGASEEGLMPYAEEECGGEGTKEGGGGTARLAGRSVEAPSTSEGGATGASAPHLPRRRLPSLLSGPPAGGRYTWLQRTALVFVVISCAPAQTVTRWVLPALPGAEQKGSALVEADTAQIWTGFCRVGFEDPELKIYTHVAFLLPHGPLQSPPCCM